MPNIMDHLADRCPPLAKRHHAPAADPCSINHLDDTADMEKGWLTIDLKSFIEHEIADVYLISFDLAITIIV